MYASFFKRLIDFLIALIALIVLSPLLLVLTISGTVVMHGNPFFVQPRPGRKGKDGKETIFYLIKFRTMSNKTDDSGKLLPDEQRLNGYGRFLRMLSLDELPSLLLVLIGKLSWVGPRPQLIRDMVFMTDEQRRRHDIRPGITGYAQVNGRNNIPWERKFEYDLEYIDAGITFIGDFKILLKTVSKVLKRSDVVRTGTVSDIDFGDWLLGEGKVTEQEYIAKMAKAKKIQRV